MYFSLKTETLEQKNKVALILDELKTIFGEDNIEAEDYDLWTSINIDNVLGYLDLDWRFTLHIFRRIDEEEKESIDIPSDLICMVYSL